MSEKAKENKVFARARCTLCGKEMPLEIMDVVFSNIHTMSLNQHVVLTCESCSDMVKDTFVHNNRTIATT
jgi:hypothetical protein